MKRKNIDISDPVLPKGWCHSFSFGGYFPNPPHFLTHLMSFVQKNFFVPFYLISYKKYHFWSLLVFFGGYKGGLSVKGGWGPGGGVPPKPPDFEGKKG